jgi:dihydrodipicolinate synthase/N-acetylneuraminate lyase
MTRPTSTGQKFEGVFAILTTPFNADWSLDEPGLRAHCDFLAAAPVDVVVALGTESESYALTDAERRRVAEVVVEAIAGRKLVICGVSHPSTVESVALARHAKAAGADAVMSLAPYFVKPSLPGDRRRRDPFFRIQQAGPGRLRSLSGGARSDRRRRAGHGRCQAGGA